MHTYQLTNHIIQALSQSSTTASPGARPPYCRSQYTRGRIVQVFRCPSLRFYIFRPNGLDETRSVLLQTLTYTLSGVCRWSCWCDSVFNDALTVGVFRLIGPPTSIDSFGVSFCAFKQKQMNSYHENTASKDGNDEDERYARR